MGVNDQEQRISCADPPTLSHAAGAFPTQRPWQDRYSASIRSVQAVLMNRSPDKALRDWEVMGWKFWPKLSVVGLGVVLLVPKVMKIVAPTN